MKARIIIIGLAFLVSVPANLLAASDFQWTFTGNGIAYILDPAPSSPLVYSGSIPANNPTLNLILGKRYGVTVTNAGSHPFEVIAAGVSDTVLLSQAAAGSLEGDSGINWVEGGNTAEFTVTQALVDAMTLGGATPAYRCSVHTTTMRGTFALYNTGSAIANPIAARIAKGNITIELETVASGLVSPLGLTQPDDATDRLFIYDQAGKVWIVQNGSLLPTPFLDVSGRLVTLMTNYDERGLLGFATHPNFSSHPKVYTYTSEPVAGSADFTVPITGSFNHQSVVAEWAVDAGNPNLIDVGSRRELMRIDEPQFNHNGGSLRFGADGMLYISLGDGGNANDVGDGHNSQTGNAQDVTNVLGKLLRIDVDSNSSANGQYGIPADNPFVNATGVDEIWAYGLRNPYAFSFDQATGDLYLGDAGQDHVEEVDIITKGGNYGWHWKEGSFYFDPSNGNDVTVPVQPLPSGLVDPLVEYDHDDGTVVVGGAVYRASAISSLAGRYICGDFGTSFSVPSGRLFYIDESGDLVEFQIGKPDRALGLWVKGFGQDRSGNIYVCGTQALGPTGASGSVLKVIPYIANSAGSSWTNYP